MIRKQVVWMCMLVFGAGLGGWGIGTSGVDFLHGRAEAQHRGMAPGLPQGVHVEGSCSVTLLSPTTVFTSSAEGDVLYVWEDAGARQGFKCKQRVTARPPGR